MSDQFANPSKTIIFLALLLFPFALIGYLVLLLVKRLEKQRIRKRFKKTHGREMNVVELLTLDFDLAIKYRV